MTPHQIIAVCLRLLAVVWALYMTSQAYAVFVLLDSELGTHSVVVWVLTIAQIALCLVLWFFPMTIATTLLSSAATASAPTTKPGMLEWQTLGVICVGLWGMLRAIPDAIYWVSFWSMSSNAGMLFSDIGGEQKAGMLATVVEVAISAWLLFGAKGFAAFLYKARTAGVSKS